MSDMILENLTLEKLKKLNYKEVRSLCAEIRDLLIETASKNGGHLASNLGVVELTVALHRVFDSPKDQIVFDVGHQCYTHKLLTGRYGSFSTLRTENGISGFLKPEESEHDCIISGHSSNSISAACGLARANRLRGRNASVVAVIGDGALTGGLAYEGLNDAGRERDAIIVVLNDNQMSISKNVGAMARYLTKVRTKKSYVNFKSKLNALLLNMPLFGKPIRRFLLHTKSLIKRALYGSSTMFDSLGFAYIGPIDGHDQAMLEQALEVAKSLKRPILVHVCTTKGKGYDPAERSPETFHGIGKFDIDSGETVLSGKQSFSNVFGEKMCELAAADDKVCAVTAAMVTGTGLFNFAEKFNDRFFDCGIAEQHATVFSAGLAINGEKPVFAVYSSFFQRAYDQVIHDVAIGKVGVTFAIDRAGLVGEDGETHQGLFDVAMLGSIPGITVYSPAYFSELKFFLEKCVNDDAPNAIRYPRGTEPYKPAAYVPSLSDMELIKGVGDTLIVSYGRLSGEVFKALESLKEENLKPSFLKLNRIIPLPEGCLQTCMKYKKIIFFEEAIERGSVGERLAFELGRAGFSGKIEVHAVAAKFVKQATVENQLKTLGLDSNAVVRAVRGEK